MGIDYGMGKTNVDLCTGIRYGVINQNECLQAWADSAEAYYGEPICPDCGGELTDYIASMHLEFEERPGCADFACEACAVTFDAGDVIQESPISWVIHDDIYTAESDEYGDIFITESLYYTMCEFCSPCAPGAGYLMTRGKDCKAYCFGHDFFDGGKAPYPVFSVETNQKVEPEQTCA